MPTKQELAERFAPVVYHANDEPNFPANVDWFLSRTSLWFYDRNCDSPANEKLIDHPSQRDLVEQVHAPTCGAVIPILSAGSRSKSKWRTFYLKDVPVGDRKGCTEARDWTTYCHVYSSSGAGTTIQYWRFHAYNTGLKVDLGPILGSIPNIEIGCHGGDWEGIHVVLDAAESPLMVRLLGHTGISHIAWDAIQKDGTHPIVYSERGGHATLANDGAQAGFDKTSGIAHKTWMEGGLVDLGEKTSPSNDQFFVQYSGLWGTPSDLPKSIFLIPSDLIQKGFFASSGYWGPAFNETDMRTDDFITAWGEGCVDEGKTVGGVPEYRPTHPIP